MKKLVLIICIMILTQIMALSDPLEKYLWKNRILLTFAPNDRNVDRIDFLDSINKNLCGVSARDIIHIDFIFKKKDKKFVSYVERFSISQKEFRIVLIGKDGGVKLNSSYETLEEIFSLIDNMPMRQKEMLNDNCN